MEIKESKLKGVFEITLNPITDDRGFFMRVFDDKIFAEHHIQCKWVQENHSRSKKKGTLRGLHFQFPPFAEAKLVRCVRGAVFDVFVDLCKNSETFGHWDSVELSEENNKMVFIPRGFAHGFCTLENDSHILYKVDNYYAPAHEGGILWSDSDLDIHWPISNPVLSDKDKANMTFNEFKQKYGGIKL